jgi:mono/diheme cytochrome c family protein
MSGPFRPFGLLLLLLAGFSACTKKEPQAPPSPLTGEALVERGKTIYKTNCISCHNPQPSKTGAVGPDVAGSSLELLESRILTVKYPEGYKPKRGTALMPAMPYLKNEIQALHAFLTSPAALSP